MTSPYRELVNSKRQLMKHNQVLEMLFVGRGYNHRIRKFSNGQFRCSCGLWFPDRKEAWAHLTGR